MPNGNTTNRNAIVLVTPRERVQRVLATASLLGLQVGALAAAGMVSPLALLAGSTGMLVASASLHRRETRYEAELLSMAIATRAASPHTDSQRFLGQIARLAGLRHPVLIENDDLHQQVMQPGQDGLTLASGSKAFVLLNPDMRDLPNASALWVGTHELMHAARGDVRPGNNPMFRASIFRWTGLWTLAGFGAFAAASAATALPVAALPAGCALAFAMASTLPDAVFRTLQDERDQARRQGLAQAAGRVHFHELEAERATCDLLGLNASYATYANEQHLAQHYRNIGLKPPAFMQASYEQTRQPGLLTRGFNRLCSLLCRPLTMPHLEPDLSTRPGRKLAIYRQP